MVSRLFPRLSPIQDIIMFLKKVGFLLPLVLILKIVRIPGERPEIRSIDRLYLDVDE